MTIENISEKFNLDTYMAARKTAMKAALLFAQHVNVGMNFKDMEGLLDEIFKLLKIEKKWHMSKIRIGSDTQKTFKEKSDELITLKEEDIYFIDIGPVIDEHEADYGMTFTKGHNPRYAKIQKASRDIFELAKKEYKDSGLSGKELYDFVEKEAISRGYELDQKMRGHRLGDFPHHVFHRGALGDLNKKPIENLWVLEVHIICPKEKVGAFFEDILF
ncbi:MAG: M24 family metallopeptidase [Bacteriovoracaceae bacterium]|jgi:methionine aminopeptidase|nr:M24 family metallopeptidase [Bacteriovoracaceae bacterium]